MDDDNDIIFIDDDERNARVSDHRTKGGPFGRTVSVPRRARRVVVQTGSREPVVVREAQTADRMMYPPYPTAERRLFGNLTTSEAVEVAAQILASLSPLPVAPVATGKVETDVENLTMFHNAVAMHFKRDEQLRTIGSLLAKLMS